MRVLVVFLSVLLSLPALAQSADDVNAAIDSNFGDHAAFEAAIQSIQFAIAEGDAAGVAAWVAYPITINPTGDALVIENEAEFVQHYGDFMTDEIVNAVATQEYGDLFVNAEGVMFGNGQLWVSGVCRDDACAQSDVRIITIQSTAE